MAFVASVRLIFEANAPLRLIACCALFGAVQVAEAGPPMARLQLWLDATDTVSVVDAQGLNPDNAGFTGSVAQWSDKSGQGNAAFAADANQPLYSQNGLNAKATVAFGTSQFFDLTRAITTSDETIFLVTRMYDNGDNRGPWLGTRMSYLGLLNDANRYFFTTTGGEFLISSPAPIVNAIVVSRRSAGITTIFENGSAVIVDAIGASGDFVIDSVGIYNRGIGAPRTFFGAISEILIYDYPMSMPEMENVGSYLAAKYALSTAYPTAINVAIDIKPGDPRNRLNPRSKGVLPVAILSSQDFNVVDVRIDSVIFAAARPERFAYEDVNVDGLVDLVLHFRTQDVQLTSGSYEGTLTGELSGGGSIAGTDRISIVPGD
jgi:hypothetical protein